MKEKKRKRKAMDADASTPCGQAASGRFLPFWTPHAVRPTPVDIDFEKKKKRNKIDFERKSSFD
jgi:hypothetical protein